MCGLQAGIFTTLRHIGCWSRRQLPRPGFRFF